MFLIDTNVVSELRKAGDDRADANVVAWFAEHDASTCYLSVISIMELEIGILRILRRDVVQGEKLRSWMDHRVLPEFAGRILPVDMAITLRCAPLHVPDPRPERDALLAATAMVLGLTVVTRNAADFEPTGVPVINPWTRG